MSVARGFRDVLGPHIAHLAQSLRDVAFKYGCREITLPVVEKAALYGTAVEAGEMFALDVAHGGGDRLVLRPEVDICIFEMNIFFHNLS
jgi:histidyl-tRNA synthetase